MVPLDLSNGHKRKYSPTECMGIMKRTVEGRPDMKDVSTAHVGRIHGSLRVTPAMAVGLTDMLDDMEWIVGLIGVRAPKPNRPSIYKRQEISKWDANEESLPKL